MPRLQRKSLTSPDLVRSFPFGHVDIVNLDETSVARFSWQPGWRWSKDVAPVVQTRSCLNRHVGYAVSGLLHVQMEDGTELEIRAGDVYEIPPGHDAWVVGDEPVVAIDWQGASVWAARQA
jgi:quercetin dioxygenase-like cupin family protein